MKILFALLPALFLFGTVQAKSYTFTLKVTDPFGNNISGMYVELYQKGKTVAKIKTGYDENAVFINLKLKEISGAVSLNNDLFKKKHFYIENKDKKNQTHSVQLNYKTKELINDYVQTVLQQKLNEKGITLQDSIPKDLKCDSNSLESAFTESSFYNGTAGMMEYISAEVVYPQKSVERDEQGKVYVQFIVEKNGTITDVLILKGVSKEINQEALRVVKEMPNWIPAFCNGYPVRTKAVLPIAFSLN